MGRSEGKTNYRRTFTPPEDFAREVIEHPSGDDVEEHFHEVAAALMMHGANGGQDVIMRTLVTNPTLGRDFVHRLASHLSGDVENLFARWEPWRLAELFVWIKREIPEPDTDDWNEPLPMLSNQIAGHISKLGTPEACEALRSILIDLPDLGWIRRLLAQAESKLRGLNWITPSLEHLARLRADNDRRFVASQEDFFRLVCEAIDRWQIALREDRAVIEAVWNNPYEVNASPKKEEQISAQLQRWLQTQIGGRRVTVNVETEINIGREIDLLVQAFGERERKTPFQVLIEMKGEWNTHVESALADQLVERYHGYSECKHGIYIVCRFPGQKAKKPAADASNIADALKAQADQALEDGITVATRIVDCGLPPRRVKRK